MNTKSICVVCGREFEYRKGKLYCSNSCKTKGFNLRKAGLSGFDSENSNEMYNQARTTFYFSDYTALKDKEYCSFEQYCFLIKNFPNDEDVNFLNDYVTEFVSRQDFENNLKNNQHPVRKKYLEFLERFHDGNYKIQKERNSK